MFSYNEPSLSLPRVSVSFPPTLWTGDCWRPLRFGPLSVCFCRWVGGLGRRLLLLLLSHLSSWRLAQYLPAFAGFMTVLASALPSPSLSVFHLLSCFPLSPIELSPCRPPASSLALPFPYPLQPDGNSICQHNHPPPCHHAPVLFPPVHTCYTQHHLGSPCHCPNHETFSGSPARAHICIALSDQI